MDKQKHTSGGTLIYHSDFIKNRNRQKIYLNTEDLSYIITRVNIMNICLILHHENRKFAFSGVHVTILKN